MIFFYLPAIGLIHVLSAAALGFLSVLSGKALSDMRHDRGNGARRHEADVR